MNAIPSFNPYDPAVFNALSPAQQGWVKNGKFIAQVVKYFYRISVSGEAAILELVDQTVGRTKGLTNFNYGKIENDMLLLGIGLKVAYSASAFSSAATLRNGDYSNLKLNPTHFQQDSSNDTTGALVPGRSITLAQGLRIDPYISNAEIKSVVDGVTIHRRLAEDFFIDAFQKSDSLVGDMSNYISLLPAPRLITKDQVIKPTAEFVGTVGNYYALSYEMIGVEIAQG